FQGEDQFSYQISDGRGGSDNATVIIQVRDLTRPQVRPPPDLIILLDSDESEIPADDERIVAFLAGTAAVDDVDGEIEAAAVDAPDVFPAGETAIRFEAKDSAGNVGAATALVILLANNDPVAIDDYLEVPIGDVVEIPVLANDLDPDGDALTVTIVTSPEVGELTLRDDGSFIYQPEPDYEGEISFSYRIADGRGGSDTAIVTILYRKFMVPPPRAQPEPEAEPEEPPIGSPGPLTAVRDWNQRGICRGPADFANIPLAFLSADPENRFITTEGPFYQAAAFPLSEIWSEADATRLHNAMIATYTGGAGGYVQRPGVELSNEAGFIPWGPTPYNHFTVGHSYRASDYEQPDSRDYPDAPRPHGSGQGNLNAQNEWYGFGWYPAGSDGKLVVTGYAGIHSYFEFDLHSTIEGARGWYRIAREIGPFIQHMAPPHPTWQATDEFDDFLDEAMILVRGDGEAVYVIGRKCRAVISFEVSPHFYDIDKQELDVELKPAPLHALATVLARHFITRLADLEAGYEAMYREISENFDPPPIPSANFDPPPIPDEPEPFTIPIEPIQPVMPAHPNFVILQEQFLSMPPEIQEQYLASARERPESERSFFPEWLQALL
ncbi:MAG: cadherin-like domain-containing protein, partial [Proteobacteria bacterium]|nr:cadherin-like domain-containing protein [Pseudomonadota bacterium]